MVFCGNCDSRKAKVECSNCSPSLPLCMGCSVTHPSIKMFKGHKMRVLNDQKPMKEKMKKPKRAVRFDSEAPKESSRAVKVSPSEVSVEEFDDGDNDESDLNMFDSMRDTLSAYILAEDWKSRLVVIGMSTVAYVIIKMLLGRLSGVLLVVGAYAVVRNSNANKLAAGKRTGDGEKPISWWEDLVNEAKELWRAVGVLINGSDYGDTAKELNRVREELYSDPPPYDEKDFKEEFWHNNKPRRRNMQVQMKGSAK